MSSTSSTSSSRGAAPGERPATRGLPYALLVALGIVVLIETLVSGTREHYLDAIPFIYAEKITHAESGTHRYPGIIWKMARTPNAIRMPPCRLGEHNDYAYRELLGLNEERYREMEEAGHIGTNYAPEIG